MTSPAFKLLAPKNNATTPTLLGAIGASDTTIVLGSGHGAYLPTILRGDCSSTGDARTLNDTGALASVAVGDYIYNLTDGSWAVVITGGTNSIRTTPLEGGSDNTWQSGDIWVVGMFVATITQFSGSTIVKQERILVTNRVSDTLTAVRGFDSDTALSFLAGDSVQILMEEAQIEEMHNAIRNILGKIDAIHRGVPFYIGETGGSANAYTGTLTPTITTLSDIEGVPIMMRIHTANTTTSTFAPNGLTAKNIKKEGGATNLASGDLATNMTAVVVYNATLDAFVLVNPPANAPATADLTISDKTADYTVVSGDTQKVLTNNGATSEILFTMVASPTVGKEYLFSTVSDMIFIKPNSGQTLYDADGLTMEMIMSGGSGNMISYIARTTTAWIPGRKIGTWSVARGYPTAGRTTTPVTTIDRIKAIDDTVAAISAVTSTTLYGRSGVSNPLYGYAMGGVDSSDNANAGIEKFTFVSETSAANSVSLTTARGYQSCGTNSNLNGYHHGGYHQSGNKTEITRLIFASGAQANLAAVMTAATERNTGGESSTKGYSFSGSNLATTANALTFSTEANALVSVTITSRIGGGRVQGLTNIYLAGGGAPIATISRYVLASDTESVIAATLQNARNELLAGINLSSGYLCGGENAGGQNKIDKFTWASEACAANANNLSSSRSRVCSLNPVWR